MKKICCLILVLSIVLSAINVLAEGYETQFKYDNETKTLTITSLADEDSSLEDTGHEGGCKFFMDYPWDKYCEEAEKVVFDEGVKIVPAAALARFKEVKEIVISDSVTAIGDFAFYDCHNLETIKLPANLEKLGYEALYGIEAMKEITLPAKLTNFSAVNCTGIENIWVEEGNTSLKSVDGVLYSANGEELVTYPAGRGGEYAIASGTKIIGDRAVAHAKNLTDITIPNTVTTINAGAFSNCSKLVNVKFEEGSTLKTIDERCEYWGDEYDEIFGAFAYCDSLTELTFPDSLETVYQYLIYGSKNLKTLNFGANFKGVSKQTKYDSERFFNKHIENINVTKNNPYVSSINGVLYSKDLKTLIIFPPAKKANTYKVNAKTVEIAPCAFIDAKVKKIVLSKKTKTLGAAAFSRCKQLKAIVNTNNVKTFDRSVFSNCKRLASVEFKKLTTVPASTFYGCKRLKSVTLGKNVKRVSGWAFDGCKSLRKFVIRSKNAKIAKKTFVTAKYKNKFYYRMNKPKKFVICGLKNSTAEKYAKKYKIKFKKI